MKIKIEVVRRVTILGILLLIATALFFLSVSGMVLPLGSTLIKQVDVELLTLDFVSRTMHLVRIAALLVIFLITGIVSTLAPFIGMISISNFLNQWIDDIEYMRGLSKKKNLPKKKK